MIGPLKKEKKEKLYDHHGPVLATWKVATGLE